MEILAAEKRGHQIIQTAGLVFAGQTRAGILQVWQPVRGQRIGAPVLALLILSYTPFQIKFQLNAVYCFIQQCWLFYL